ncbi:MAG TPA: hypothetical protein VF407_12145 [Polyangiaceae bacterium]
MATSVVSGTMLGIGCSGNDSPPCPRSDASTDVEADATAGEGGQPLADGAVTDGAAGIDGSTIDSGPVDAGPPAHVIFVTTSFFTGNLVHDANNGAAGSLTAPDGGAFEDYRSAVDAICTNIGNNAGYPGPFRALVTAGTDRLKNLFTDADGPWALVDGTPVADNATELTSGDWHAPVDMTENGAPVVPSYQSDDPWGAGYTGYDCDGFTSTTLGKYSISGSSVVVGSSAVSNFSYNGCDHSYSIRCAQVGPGAGRNRYPAVTSTTKIAFVAAGPFPYDFGASDGAGVLDASPGPGDQAHAIGDAICNEVAANSGKPGTYRAWVSSTATSAASYFEAHAMTGPWSRPDGLVVADSVADIVNNHGLHEPLSYTADGRFTFYSNLLTGTLMDGGIGPNCVNFTSSAFADSVEIASGAAKSWSGSPSSCQQSSPGGSIACFQQ